MSEQKPSLAVVAASDLQAEIDRLTKENADLKLAEDGVIPGGMTESKNKTERVLRQQPFKGEKIAATTRTDMNYDPTQRFNVGRPV